MNKFSLLICFLVFSACNRGGNNVPEVAVETPEIIKEAEEIEKTKFDLSLIMTNDILPIETEKCTLSEHPFISFRRSYEKASLKYLGDNTFDFNLQDYMDPLTGEGSNTNFTLGMELTSDIKDQAYFNLINREEYVSQDIYFDLLVVGSWKIKELISKKMVLTANVFGDQCDYTFTIPSAHDADNDGINDNLDCAPQDSTRTYWREYNVDFDGDGFGSTEPISICAGQSTNIPVGYAAASGDCDDTSPNINPDSVEILGDGIDNNCDGTDEQIASDTDQDGTVDLLDCAPDDSSRFQLVMFYQDQDQDGEGYPGSTQSMCVGSNNGVAGYSKLSTDCNDLNPRINSGALEIPGDAIDNNCDGNAD